MPRPSITLACIAKNEAENVKRLFDSVSGCVDEIVLTDTGSTDGTAELASSLGATVKNFTWIDDFGAARNFSFEGIKTDYVMWLDLDDVLERPEGFKLFRDNVMGLADFWIASYHYASDPKGRPLCTFARERVFRTNLGLQWKYPVHEGVLPGPGTRIQFTPSWAVRHMRTETDLQKDRSRNLNLFQKMKAKGPMDPRMQYYYGKELLEAGKPVEAGATLLDVLSQPGLELHDRILGYQFAGFAFAQCNQMERVIDLAHCGLHLDPNRAEFYTMIGDCYLKMNRPQDAMPMYAAAKACKIQVPQGFASAIFHHEDLYTAYPRNQIARIHANLGDLDGALTEIQESVHKYATPESQAICDEITRIHGLSTSYRNAQECEDIVITCPPNGAYTWDAGIAKTKSMGGSETAAIEMAQWLHKLSGRPVKIFNMRDDVKTIDGVEYLPAAQMQGYMAKHRPWLHIAWRHNAKVTDALTYLWCHDLYTPGAENHSVYEKMLCLTPFHKRYNQVMQGIPDEKIWVTRNGIRPDRFTDGPWEKDPNKFIFSSSPDRGLDRAMRVLDRVRVKYPDIKLHVYYGIEHLGKFGLQGLQDELNRMMDERKEWVIYHGATQQDELMKEFKSAAYCVQPSDFIESSMISAMERLFCGVYQVIRSVGGVVDTLAEANRAGMATLVESDCITEREYDFYAAKVIEVLDQKAYQRIHSNPESWSWESVAKDWLEFLPKEKEGVNGSAA